MSFHGDEWAYIVDRRLTFESLLQPHNEHLVFLQVLTYRTMVEMFGTGSYTPFMVALMATHVTMAVGVYVLLRRVISVEGALAASILLLFLGTGFDNLVWAFQTGFVGAASLGVWALALAHRPLVASLLLTAALWTQSNSLAYIAPAIFLVAQRRWLIVPVASVPLEEKLRQYRD